MPFSASFHPIIHKWSLWRSFARDRVDFTPEKERVRVKVSLKVLDPESITGRYYCYSFLFFSLSLPFELQSSPSSPHGFSAFDERARLTTRWDVGRLKRTFHLSKSLPSFPSSSKRWCEECELLRIFFVSLKFNLESCRWTPRWMQIEAKITGWSAVVSWNFVKFQLLVIDLVNFIPFLFNHPSPPAIITKFHDCSINFIQLSRIFNHCFGKFLFINIFCIVHRYLVRYYILLKSSNRKKEEEEEESIVRTKSRENGRIAVYNRRGYEVHKREKRNFLAGRGWGRRSIR